MVNVETLKKHLKALTDTNDVVYDPVTDQHIYKDAIVLIELSSIYRLRLILMVNNGRRASHMFHYGDVIYTIDVLHVLKKLKLAIDETSTRLR